MDREKMRLIDANAEKAKVDVIINSLVFGDEDEEMLAFMNTLRQLLHTAFNEAPTIEAEPVRHGRWEWGEDGWQCGECKKPLKDTLIFYFDNCNGEPDVNYCPHCGAKMDGDPI